MRILTKEFLYLFVFLMLVWLALTASVEFEELSAGILISFMFSFFLNKTYFEIGLPKLSIKKVIFFLFYIFVLLWEIAKANIDVAYRVLNPKMPIRPGIVVVKTNLKQKLSKVILANSITLTPGTFTLDILGDNLLVHWINVKTEDTEMATKVIARKFEKYLRMIFE
jgi:multicomponent Na+:H+ antiporter subunit E